MCNSSAYSGITTKVKAMSSRLITTEDYKHISQLETVPEFIAFLKHQPAYQDLFAGFDETTLHRGQVEQILTDGLFIDYTRIFRFATMEQRRILTFVFARYEVNVLKSCLQRVFSNTKILDLSKFVESVQKYTKLRIEELSTARTMDEFITLLKDTEYYPLFIRMQNSGTSTLYDYEAQLDIYFFKKVWKMKDRMLRGSDRAYITKILGTQVDLLNIMWIYRSKKFYDMDYVKIYASIIPCNYKLKRLEISKMVEAATLDEFLNALGTTYYGTIYKDALLTSMETVYRQRLNKLYEKTQREHPASMAPILCFLHLKEMELDRLTTALECIRYKLEPDRSIQFVLDL